MGLTATERKYRAKLRGLPPGRERDFYEWMLPDRQKAIKRFQKVVER